jgi:Flp pilus assembly protein TadG
MTRRPPSTTRAGRHGNDDGSAALELVILAPVLLLLFGVLIAGARIRTAETSVEQAAGQAARAASLSRTSSQAHSAADDAARAVLARQGLTCTTSAVHVDTSGLRAAVGQRATISVRVTCRVPLADLAIPGMPGTRQVEATAVSSLDTYRSRR